MSDTYEGLDSKALSEMALLTFTSPIPQYLLAESTVKAEGRRLKALEIACQFDVDPDEYLETAHAIHAFLDGSWKPAAKLTSIEGGKIK